MNNKLITNIMNKYIDENVINESNLDYNDTINIYNNINLELKKNNIGSYEINNYLSKNKNENYIKYIKYKNKLLLGIAIKSSNWKNIIDPLKKLNNDPNNDVNKKIIKLFKNKYIQNWDGFWTIQNIDINGKIIYNNLIDIDDINYIIK